MYNRVMPPRKLSEEHTRKELIDPQLERAGWVLRDHSKVKEEIPVEALKTSEVSETSEVWARGVTDYCHLRPQNGEALAVVEAKSMFLRANQAHFVSVK